MLKFGPHIIKSPVILAPMAGVSQMPFRRMALQMGAGLAPTELVSAKGLMFDSTRSKSYLIHDLEVEKPYCVQLFGGETESMAIAAEKAMSMGADIIDINMGCPVKKVTKINAGSALLCDILRAQKIVEAMLKRTNFKIPITAKIRSGWDHAQLNFLEVGKALEDAGIAAIAIHARTRAQGYSGKADWSHIKELKQHVKIPVIGNGDVRSLNDALTMSAITGCDAVMLGRAASGNPWIFRDLLSQKEICLPTSFERWQVVKSHFEAHIELYETIASLEKRPANDCQIYAIRSFRSHLIWYSKGLINAAKFRHNILASDCLVKTQEVIEEFFSQAQMDRYADGTYVDDINYRQAFG